MTSAMPRRSLAVRSAAIVRWTLSTFLSRTKRGGSVETFARLSGLDVDNLREPLELHPDLLGVDLDAGEPSLDGTRQSGQAVRGTPQRGRSWLRQMAQDRRGAGR